MRIAAACIASADLFVLLAGRDWVGGGAGPISHAGLANESFVRLRLEPRPSHLI
jgi:hypothetical protein